MSGISVERRDQVLMTRLSPRRFSSSTFFSRWSSTNGPLLSDLGTPLPSSLGAPAPDAGPSSLPAVAPGLADGDELVGGVANLADGGAAPHLDEPHLPRGQPQRCHRSLFGHELDRRSGRAGDLG